MNISWMGRYRALVETIVKHRNAYARVMNTCTEHSDQISVSILEWEVLEYIIEHGDDDASMAQLSDRLAIPPSSLTGISKRLCQKGLAAKYQMVGNKKNVILKSTDVGLKFYAERSEYLGNGIFGEFFKELDGLTDEELEHVIRAIEILTPAADNSDDLQVKTKLVRIE